jgi:hypothetical protein
MDNRLIPDCHGHAHLCMGGYQLTVGMLILQMITAERISAPGSLRIYTQGTVETALRRDTRAIPVKGNSRMCSNFVSRESCPPCWVLLGGIVWGKCWCVVVESEEG